MTLTHFKNNNWADSSTDKPAHNGLTPFGKDVVRELNRLGMMVDISHVADKTFYDVLALTKAPVIASHSSCRAIANHPRNMTDDMMRALAKNGGVVMINYHAGFLSEEFRVASEKKQRQRRHVSWPRCRRNAAATRRARRWKTSAWINEAMMNGQLPKVSWEKIVEHIDHAVKVAGADHVGLGSDFDGATMPIGMEDASKLPKITDALLKKGYCEADIEKILGGNLLRVMEQVEKGAGKYGGDRRVGCWVRGAGCSGFVLGFWVRGSGFWVLGAGHWVHVTEILLQPTCSHHGSLRSAMQDRVLRSVIVLRVERISEIVHRVSICDACANSTYRAASWAGIG